MIEFLFKALLYFLAGLGIGAILVQQSPTPKDDSDPPDGRSGLVIYTDHLTGCQYLRAGSVFSRDLTPRLDKQGKQICK
jgi:Family of unknown function (DUF6440)